MTRHSLENLTNRASTDTWTHDPNSVEMQPAPNSRLSVNEWRTSSDAILPAPEDPFQDPVDNPHRSSSPSSTVNHPSVAHTHQDHAEHQDNRPAFTADIEAVLGPPKTPGTPSITALPLNLPSIPSQTPHPQTFHRIFLVARLSIQILLFVLALVGFLLKYPKTITYSGMLTGNSLAFVLTWSVALVLVYWGDKGVRMTRWAEEREQMRKCGRLLVIDCVVVGVWLCSCWGNTAFARGVMDEAAKKAVGGPGKNLGAGVPKVTPTGLVPKPTGH